MFARLAAAFAIALSVWAVGVRGSGAADVDQIYVVKPADTLWSIASSTYRGDPREAVWKLRRRNGLESPILQPGQRLILP